MHSRTLDEMRARARAVRMRARVRAWSYRQRNLAAGVWFRLRRVLADAQAAWAIPEDEGRRLVAEGYEPEPCGRELSPEKIIVFVDEARLSTIESRRPIRVDLGPGFLGAAAIALLAFDGRRPKRM
jgi:hypothetical protein